MSSVRRPAEHFETADHLIWRDGRAIERGRLAAAASAFAAQLPATSHVINLCEGRATFIAAFLAAAARGIVTLLPPGGVAGQMMLRQRYPNAPVIGDGDRADFTVDLNAGQHQPLVLPALDQIVAEVFTSGSTGQPQAHAKTWRNLAGAGRRVAERLSPGGTPLNLVATVPHQHMYGLETAILLPLVGHYAVHDARPGFPDDIRAALAAIPAPRLLVTTPVHLRALLGAGVVLPPLAAILSATAPLPRELASQAEAAFAAPVFEIYGCTEAGSLATRRTIEGPHWTLLADIRLETEAKPVRVTAPHLEIAVPLQDMIESDGVDGFRLVGRAQDLLKVGGRRASLSELTQTLLSIPGVVDGIVFQPGRDDDVVQRPAALVVAPDISEHEIIQALAHRIDPVFLPRPLRKLAALPRNAVGKLPHATLMQLLGGR